MLFLQDRHADYVKTTNFTFDQGRFYSETEGKAPEMWPYSEVKLQILCFQEAMLWIKR